VTVVIPAYNAAATIDETLYSVRAQTHRNLEIMSLTTAPAIRHPSSFSATPTKIHGFG